VKVSDAPRSGWYPDPEGEARLRWWDGTDWSDRYRPRPHQESSARTAPADQGVDVDPEAWSNTAAQIPQMTQAVVEQMRLTARQEATLAAEEFTRRAREVTGAIPPLISQYTNKFMRYLRIALTLGFVVLVIWIAYQLWVQKSIFDWIGDRIDNLTDENASAAALTRW
jgi:hypothetical protein